MRSVRLRDRREVLAHAPLHAHTRSSLLGALPCVLQVNQTVSVGALLLCWLLLLIKLVNRALKDLTKRRRDRHGSRYWVAKLLQAAMRAVVVFFLWLFVLVFMNGALKFDLPFIPYGSS